MYSLYVFKDITADAISYETKQPCLTWRKAKEAMKYYLKKKGIASNEWHRNGKDWFVYRLHNKLPIAYIERQ